jgi:hypothetical protein
LKFVFDYDGGGPGKGGVGTLFVNGEEGRRGTHRRTQAGIFSADETADVGIDLGTPVVEAIGSEAASKFNGHIPLQCQRGGQDRDLQHARQQHGLLRLPFGHVRWLGRLSAGNRVAQLPSGDAQHRRRRCGTQGAGLAGYCGGSRHDEDARESRPDLDTIVTEVLETFPARTAGP